ncbi:hypothetical protein [Nocardia sp. NBC_01329]|uniref:hypothetical protein n=1 Tax=Nocardia sp. NBC_01329 TaxID=2903594 RepID=UPI002E105D52|nr:hypothetical protein OG405_08535 [Nocardia sp. NBC_01329]
MSRVLSCVLATAAPLLSMAPQAVAAPDNPYSCMGPYLSNDGSAEVESCIYVEDGVPRAFGGLTIKNDTLTRENCTMVVTVVDKDAYAGGASDEVVATSGAFPCLNGRYPSPPLTVDAALAKPGHRYVSFTEVTKDGQGIARIYSPELVLP